MTTDKTMTPQEFALLARRAGLELTAEEIDALFEEIAASCALMSEMAERVKARLGTASEPAHLFQADGETPDDRR
jgi:hypothetical protein